MTIQAENLSLNDSSASDWDQLPPAELPPDIAPATAQPDKPEPGVCATCGDPVIREPGARGRTPKYHPDCRPTKPAATTGTVTRRSTRADAEAVQALAAFEGIVVKSAMMLSMVDKYDAFCLMVGWSQTKENLLGVLRRYPAFRKEVLNMQSGGSILGLVLSIIMTLAPILAHHGLIPGKRIAQILVNAPFTLHKIQQKLAEGAEGLTKLMEEQLAAAREANEQAARANGRVTDTANNGRT